MSEFYALQLFSRLIILEWYVVLLSFMGGLCYSEDSGKYSVGRNMTVLSPCTQKSVISFFMRTQMVITYWIGNWM